MDQSPRFENRVDAGRKLANELRGYAAERPIILALPRGGVPVGYEIARALGATLDVWIVRKVGVPWHPELGVGAVSEGGYIHISRQVLRQVDLSEEELEKAVARQQDEVDDRVRKLRRDRALPSLKGRTVILVDDGVATGGTARAAIRAIRAGEPEEIVLAVPVAAAETAEELESEVDTLVCLSRPANLYAIGMWYDDFRQTSDEEVLRILDRARAEQQERGSGHVVA